MGGILEALIGGLKGFEQGHERAKSDKIDNRRLAMDEATFDMQQRKFNLEMQKLGLELELAEYDRDVMIKSGTPDDVVKRTHDDRMYEIEKRGIELNRMRRDIDLTDSAIRENDAQAKYYEQGGAGGGAGKEKKDATYTDAIKLIDGQIETLTDQLNMATEAGDKNAEVAIRTRLQSAYRQRELFVNYEMAGSGFPMGQGEGEFGFGDAPPDPLQETPAQPPITSRTAQTAIGSSLAGVFGPIMESIRQGRDVVGAANVNTLNPNTSFQQKLAAGVARKTISDTLNQILSGGLPSARGMAQQQSVPQVAPTGQNQQPNPLLQMLFGMQSNPVPPFGQAPQYMRK